MNAENINEQIREAIGSDPSKADMIDKLMTESKDMSFESYKERAAEFAALDKVAEAEGKEVVGNAIPPIAETQEEAEALVADTMTDEDFKKEYVVPKVSTENAISDELQKKAITKLARERERESFVSNLLNSEEEKYVNTHGFFLSGQQRRKLKRTIERNYDKGKYLADKETGGLNG